VVLTSPSPCGAPFGDSSPTPNSEHSRRSASAPAVQRAMMVRGGRSVGFIGAMFDDLHTRSGEGAFKTLSKAAILADVADHCELGTLEG
jgi:hypothetical protein